MHPILPEKYAELIPMNETVVVSGSSTYVNQKLNYVNQQPKYKKQSDPQAYGYTVPEVSDWSQNEYQQLNKEILSYTYTEQQM